MELLVKQPGVIICKFKKGSCIIRHGEKIEFLYYLISGSCNRTTITEKGDEIVFGTKKSYPNSIQSLLGVLILYNDGISRSNFIAKTDCVCYKIPREVFLAHVQDKIEILNQLLAMAMEEMRELVDFYQARQAGKTANFLCAQLLKNARFEQEKLVVDNDYGSITKASSLLGIHKVTVARIFKVLKNEGIISKDKKNIVIQNKKQLTLYATGERTIGY